MRTLIIISICSLCHWAFAQNVGIGTTSPLNAKLEVEGVAPGGATAALLGSTSSGVSFQSNWPTIGFNQYRDNILPGSNGKFIANGFAAMQYFDINTGNYAFDVITSGLAGSQTFVPVRAVTVAANGHTSILTNANTATLSVGRGTGSNGTAVFVGPSYPSHFNYSSTEDTYIRAGQDNGTVFINQIPNGKILISATGGHLWINNPPAPFYTIEVLQPNGSKAFSMVDAVNNRWGMACNNLNTLNNGRGIALDLYYNNTGRGRFQFWNGAYVSLSDQRLKKDIEPMEPVLNKLKKLNPVQYEMIRNNPHHLVSSGFIAQEVQPLFPQLVRRGTDHYTKGKTIEDALVMNYSGFAVIAIKALQEQEMQIREMQQQKQALMLRLSALEQQLMEQ